jgi:hypothetical protein
MQFRTRPDGVVYPLGGSGSKKKGAGAAVAGVALVGAVVFGGGGGAAGGAAAADGLSAAAQVRVSQAQKPAARGQRGQAWKRLRVRETRRKVQQRLNCVRNSHGEVREFFVFTPCRSLDRALLLLGDGRGGLFVLSVYWVRMRTTAGARALQRLDDTYGTGNVNPVAGTLLGLAGVEFTGRYYDSRVKGPMAIIAEVEPVSGSPSSETLESVAQVATVLPGP